MKFEKLRTSCFEANQKLSKMGLVDLTFGNVSVYDPELMVFAIKPSGVDYAELTPESMVVVGLDGEVKAGELRPSSDTPTHRHLYSRWGERGVHSVVHTHSRKAVSFAQAGLVISCLGTTHSDYFNGAIPLTRYMTNEEVAADYEWETGKVIVESFLLSDPMEVPAVLVRNHGPFAWASSPEKALENALALELVADLAFQTLTLAKNALPVPQYLRAKHFHRKHGSDAYYGQLRPCSA